MKKIFTLFFLLCILVSASGQTVTTIPAAGPFTFTVPPGVTSITVYIYGGGGGGGGTANGGGTNFFCNAGGGGGGACSVQTIAVSGGQVWTATIGAGGAAGTTGGVNATAGGTTTFVNGATTYSAGGGAGAIDATSLANGATSPGGLGSNAGTGTVYAGGNGTAGNNGTSTTNGYCGIGGGGGGSGAPGSTSPGGSCGLVGAGGTGTYPGGNGSQNAKCGTQTDAAGTAGVVPGGGGGGNNSYLTAFKGGKGGAGQVVVVYYTPPTITGFSPNPVCVGSTVTITGTNLAGLIGANAVQFNGVNATSYTVVSTTSITAVVPAGAVGSGPITVIASGGTVVSGTNLTVNAIPAVPTFSNSGTNNVCPGTAETYAVTDLGLTYTWSVAGAGWSPSSGSTATFNTAAGTTNGVITVTASNGTCSTPNSVTTTVIQPPSQPVFSAAPASVCASSTQTYTVTNTAGIVYSWSVPAGWMINSGNGSNSINVTVGAAGGNVTVTPSNGCSVTGLAQFVTVSVNSSTLTLSAPIPAATAIIAGTSSVTVFGFSLTPNACAAIYSFTAVSITSGGTTATAADLSNFQLIYDVNSDGVYEPATDIIVSSAPQSFAIPLNFTVTGQTNISGGKRNYIVIADVAAGATAGHTFTGSLATTDITAPGSTIAGSSPQTAGTQTIEGSVAITAIQPAAANVLQSSFKNPVAEYQLVNNGGTYTPTSFTFQMAGVYVAADFTNLQLWQSNTNSLASASLVYALPAFPATGTNAVFNSGFTPLASGSTTFYFITADVLSTGTNADYINVATDALTNFVFNTTFIVRTGTNPTTVGNAQTIIAPLVTIAQAHPAAGTLTQNTTNNIIASYKMTASSYGDINPTSLTFTTGGTYVATTDITTFKLWVNDNNNLGAATQIGSIIASGNPQTLTFSGFSAAATITAGTTNYYLITADVANTGISGDYVNIASDNYTTNFSFTTPSAATVQKVGTNPVTAGNNQTILGPGVAISTSQPAAGNIAVGSTGNIIAVYQLDVTNATYITPTSLIFTTAGGYAGADFTNFKLYQNTAVTLSGANLAQTIAGPIASGGTLTFNSGFSNITSGITSYLIITADVAPGATLGDIVDFTSTSFSNLNFISSTGSGVAKTGTNPAIGSNAQKIVGPQVGITAVHPLGGSMLIGSINNLVAAYKLSVTGAAITPASVTLTTAGTYLGASDINYFYLYQNTSNSLSGATLVGTIAASANPQTLLFNSGFTNITAGSSSYLLLSVDISGGATPPDNINVLGVTANVNFTFSTSATITGGALAASNSQTIVPKLDVYWSGTNNWNTGTIDWGQNSGGPYTNSVWVTDGYAHLEGTAGTITVNGTGVYAGEILNPSVANYFITSSGTNNTVTLVSPSTVNIGTGTTYIGTTATTPSGIPVFAGINGLTKTGAGELMLGSPFASGSTGTIFDNAGTLTIGTKGYNVSNPISFLQGNALVLNNSNFTIAACWGSSYGLAQQGPGSLQYLTSVTSTGNSTISLYKTRANNKSYPYMRVQPTIDASTFISATNMPPLTVGGQLTVDNGGASSSTAGCETSYYAVDFDPTNYRNYMAFGSTTYTGNTTFVGYSNVANLSTNAGTLVNIDLGGVGDYTEGVTQTAGTISDNGYTTTFLGGGSATSDGSQLCLSSAVSNMTGNWTIGDVAGVNAGWAVTNTATCLTRGSVTVNNYSKLVLQVTSTVNNNITYAPSTVNVTGLGPGNDAYYPSALDFFNFTATANTTTALPSNIVLNTVGATTQVGVGVEVAGDGTFPNVNFQLNGTITGTAGMTKYGPGTLILNAQNISGYFNTYSGTTQINNGIITVNSGSNLGTGGVLMAEDNNVYTGSGGFSTVLNLNNTAQTITSLASSWNTITNSTVSQTVNINGCTLTDNQSTTTTFGNYNTATRPNLTAIIAGTGNFIKLGSGTLTLTGANTYTGITQVKAGSIVLNHTGGTTLPVTNTVDILGGNVTVSTNQTLANMTLSTGTLTVSNGITLTITGTFTLVNGSINGNGTIAYTNGTLIYAGSIAQVTNSGNPSEWPAANAPLNITFNNNTYTGYTTGSVQLNAGKAVVAGGTVTVNGWLDFFGNSLTGAGNFILKGLTTKSATGTTSTASNIITSMSTTNSMTPGMIVSASVAGIIPVGTYIIYIDPLNANTITLNNNPTSSLVGATLTVNSRGGLKVSMKDGISDGTVNSHVQLTGTRTYNSGANYVFNTPTSGTQMYPGFPTVGTTVNYSPANDVKINLGANNNMTMAAGGTGSSVEVADSLILSTGYWATNTGLITFDNAAAGLLSAPEPSYTPLSLNYTKSFIATCDNTGTPVPVAGPTIPLTGNYGFMIKNIGTGGTTGNVYFPVGASFLSAGTAGFTPAPDRMMINNQGPQDNFNVVVGYGDIYLTPQARVSRIWYVHSANSTTSDTADHVTMQLFFTERTTANWSLIENEVENTPVPFDYTQMMLVEKDYAGDPNFLSIASGSDIQSRPNGANNGYEAYAQYSVGVSPNVWGEKNGIFQFNRFSITNPGGIVLPVTVIDFRASLQGSGVLTNWTCLNETNIDHYEVQRSVNGVDFITLGSITAPDKALPSVIYNFTDPHPVTGNNYYRIKISGSDGTIRYTNIDVVNIGIGPGSVSIYPNPVTNHTFTLELTNIPAGKYSLQVYNTLGQMIINESIEHAGGSAAQPVTLPAGTARGEYHLKFLGTNLNVNKMITLQ